MRRSRPFLIIAVCICIVATSAAAEILEKKSGQRLEGRVVAQTSDVVTFEMTSGEISFRVRIPKNQIRSITREVKEGPGYCAIPLYGEIGVDVTAEALARALSVARQSKAEYIVLVVDSPGGSIDERDKIIAVLRENKELKFIAHVRNALSAAAVITLACPQIYMASEGRIGAAVPYSRSPEGTPHLIKEKFHSAIRATERAASAMGGHADLWIRGMSEDDLELSVATEHDRPKVIEGAPDGAKLIKRKGQILTMTAREALEWGLSSGTVDAIDDLKAPLGLKSWHHADKRPWQIMIDRARAARDRIQEQQEADARRAQREAYLRNVVPEVSSLQDRLEKARARASAAEEALRELTRLFDVEIAAVEANYQRAAAAAYGTDNPQYWLAVADNTRQREIAALKNRYQPQFTGYRATVSEANAEAEQIVGRMRFIVANAPPNE